MPFGKIKFKKSYKKPPYESTRIYDDPRWNEIRTYYYQNYPLCWKCLLEDRISATCEVHHIIPFGRSKTREEQEELAFDWDNVCSLCIKCHHEVHRLLDTDEERYYSLMRKVRTTGINYHY